MAEELTDELRTIDGVGEARAEEIVAIVDDHRDDQDDDLDVDDVRDLLESALDYHENGDHQYAEKFVRRALEALDDD